MLEQAKLHAQQGDYDTAMRCLDAIADTDESLKAYEDLMMRLYWELKDLRGVTVIGGRGLERALEASRDAASEDGPSLSFKKTASMFAYNLASFCWPGWDEAAIVIGPEEAAFGRACVKRHLQLVETLKLSESANARAWWMDGAHHLTALEWDEARAAFGCSASCGERAGDRGVELLARGFALLADFLVAPTPTVTGRLDEVKKELETLEDGKDYIRQMDTAQAVCENLLKRPSMA